MNIRLLRHPGIYFDPTEETPPKEETKEKTANEKFDELAEKVAKEQGILTDAEKKEKEKEEKAKEEKKEEEKEELEEEEEENSEEELDAENLAKAKYIYKLLNNPKTSVQALDILAKTAGFSLKELKEADKKEEKTIVKSIKAIVKEKLGGKIPFLSEELGDVLEEAISNAVEEKTKGLREQVENESKVRREAEMQTSFEKVVAEYEGVSDNILKEIVRLQEAKEIIPGTMSPEKYFKTCIILAADNLGLTLAKKSSEASPKPKKEVTPLSQLAGKKNITHKEGLKPTQVKTIQDAIELAAQKVDAQFAEK